MWTASLHHVYHGLTFLLVEDRGLFHQWQSTMRCQAANWENGREEKEEDWLSGADPQYPNLCLTLRSRFAWLSAAFTPVQVQVQIPTKAPGQTFAKIQLDFRFSNEIWYLYINVIWCLKIYLQCCENDNTWFLVDAWYKSLTKFMWPIWMIDAHADGL